MRPTATNLEGSPIKTLDPSWRRAALISPGDLPIASTKPGERLEDSGVSLSVEADLDDDGEAERAVVGVFETNRAELGRFLLILGRSRSGQPWQTRALFQVKGGSMFSAVSLKDAVLTWHGCLECDDECAVGRVGAGFDLRCEGQ